MSRSHPDFGASQIPRWNSRTRKRHRSFPLENKKKAPWGASPGKNGFTDSATIALIEKLLAEDGGASTPQDSTEEVTFLFTSNGKRPHGTEIVSVDDNETEAESQSSNRRRRRKRQEQEDMALAYHLQLDEEQIAIQLRGRRRVLGKEAVMDKLLPCHRRAVEYVETKARAMHCAALQSLETRFRSLGYNPSTTAQGTSVDPIQQCLNYIRDDAPIVIHLKEETIAVLVKDTHYRNLFETNTSGGSTTAMQIRQHEDSHQDSLTATDMDSKTLSRHHRANTIILRRD